MVGSRFDTSPWNLGVPLVLAASCGPPLIGDDNPGIQTLSGPEESGEGPSTTLTTNSTLTTATTSPPDCYTDADCPPNFDCIGGVCYYAGYCDDDDYCCYDECCGPECGWYYDCYSNYECGVGWACNYGSCTPIEEEIGCNVPNLGLELPIPIEGPIYALAFLDDGNAGADLLVAHGLGAYRIPAETLEPTLVTPGDFAVFGLATRDLDSDGDRDIVVAPGADGVTEVMMLRNQGGGFEPEQIPGLPSNGSIALVDIESDGFPDVYSYGWAGPLYLAFNYGDAWSEPIYVWDYTPSLGAGDLDGDGFEDVVGHGYNTFAVFGGAGLVAGTLLSGEYFATTKWAVVGDFDASGVPDVLAIEQTGNGTANVDSWQSPVLQNAAYDTWWPAPVEVATVADIDGDGYQDVIAGSYQGWLTIAWGGQQSPPDVISCVGTIPTAPIIALAAGDFTGDGRPDIATTDGVTVTVLAQSP